MQTLPTKSVLICSMNIWKSPEKLTIIIELIDKTEVLEEFFKIIETDLLQVPNGCLATIRPIDAKFERVGNIIN